MNDVELLNQWTRGVLYISKKKRDGSLKPTTIPNFLSKVVIPYTNQYASSTESHKQYLSDCLAIVTSWSTQQGVASIVT
jgi:hypothetical protein